MKGPIRITVSDETTGSEREFTVERDCEDIEISFDSEATGDNFYIEVDGFEIEEEVFE